MAKGTERVINVVKLILTQEWAWPLLSPAIPSLFLLLVAHSGN